MKKIGSRALRVAALIVAPGGALVLGWMAMRYARHRLNGHQYMDRCYCWVPSWLR